MKTFIIVSLLFVILTCLMPLNQTQATADYGIQGTQEEAKLPTFGGGGVPAFLGRVAGAGLALAGSLFLFLIIYGGILMMASAGNEATLKKGRTVITWAIIGAMVLGAAYAITSLIFSTLTAQ